MGSDRALAALELVDNYHEMNSRPSTPFGNAIRDGFIRGIAGSLEQMWAHVLEEPLPGKLARLARDLGIPRRDTPNGTRGAAEKASKGARYGTRPR
jgi:hypothetical protein